ncbi:GNAT family N-acetyltransferase [Cohnella terricola]|uniref:GNAT family N-acetyltransferase n=1 Tax=Cohnella terricola TaxID=1289167 RepID=A0A559JQG1_9BACL|nr:GNAT family N-acetyltransferase [Cohnella terricola]TVY02121.1 GNAT family N-acetyltransferase [Cohnella terricola]
MKISESWNTNSLNIRRAVTEDIEDLNRICASWQDKIDLEGEGFPEGYIENCMINGDLPPIKNAHIANYYFMVIQNKDGKIIGFFDLYHGYPDNETVWISIFLIDRETQGSSFGQEAIQSICDECMKSGWKSMGLGVHLKNWKGLRFWNNNGFNKIIKISGDKEYSATTFSIIGLKRELFI